METKTMTADYLRRFVVLFGIIVALVVSVLFAAPALADPDTEGGGDDTTKSLSFYDLSSNVAGFFSNVRSPLSEVSLSDNARSTGGSIPHEGTPWIDAVSSSGANGGALLGYIDKGVVGEAWGWIDSSLSSSSNTVYYTSLEDDNNTFLGVRIYAYYGAALSGLGLDKSTPGGIGSMIRMFGGGLMLLVYALTALVDKLLGWSIDILSTLNPFRLLFDSINSYSATYAEGMTQGQTVPSYLGEISRWISSWYGVLKGFAWGVMVPIFLGTFVMGLLLFKQMNKRGAAKNLFIRVLFIGLGVPLLGSMYTGVLSSLDGVTVGANANATQVVLSNYVDFENWAFKERLAVPAGYDEVIAWDGYRNQPTRKAQREVRNLSLAINRSAEPAFSGILGTTLESDDSYAEKILESDPSTADSGTDSIFTPTMDILFRYMTSAGVQASDFETGVKSKLSDFLVVNSSQEYKDKVAAWFTQFNSSDPKRMMARYPHLSPIFSAKASAGLTSSNQGVVEIPTGESVEVSKVWTFKTVDVDSNCGFDVIGDSAYVLADTGLNKPCNLSPLAMYNYLNSWFGSNSVTIFSSEKASSGFVRYSHSAVSQVGTGVHGFLYWLNAFVLLLSMAIIGLGYILPMLFKTLRRSIQILTSIPIAILGVVGAISKIVILVLSLIVEILGTIFVYVLVQEFLMVLPQIFEIPLRTEFGSTGVFSVGILILTAIITIGFAIMSLRVRSNVVKSIDEIVTSIINKLFGTGVPAGAGGRGGGILAGAAGGVAAGAGMAAGRKMFGGPGENAKPKTDGFGGSGKQGVAPPPSAGSSDDPDNSSGDYSDGGTSQGIGGTGPDGRPGDGDDGDDGITGSQEDTQRFEGSGEIGVSDETSPDSTAPDSGGDGGTTGTSSDVPASGTTGDPTSPDPQSRDQEIANDALDRGELGEPGAKPEGEPASSAPGGDDGVTSPVSGAEGEPVSSAPGGDGSPAGDTSRSPDSATPAPSDGGGSSSPSSTPDADGKSVGGTGGTTPAPVPPSGNKGGQRGGQRPNQPLNKDGGNKSGNKGTSIPGQGNKPTGGSTPSTPSPQTNPQTPQGTGQTQSPQSSPKGGSVTGGSRPRNNGTGPVNQPREGGGQRQQQQRGNQGGRQRQRPIQGSRTGGQGGQRGRQQQPTRQSSRGNQRQPAQRQAQPRQQRQSPQPQSTQPRQTSSGQRGNRRVENQPRQRREAGRRSRPDSGRRGRSGTPNRGNRGINPGRGNNTGGDSQV